MKCLKCKHVNDHGDHFCAECGAPLTRHVVEKRGVPFWAVGVIILCCLTMGGVGYALLQEDSKSEVTQPEKVSNGSDLSTSTEENIEPKIEAVIPDTAEAVSPSKGHQEQQTSAVQEQTSSNTNTDTTIDKITLIKNTSAKVYTINTPDNQGTGFLYKNGGYVVTNAHVAQGYVDVLVKNSAGTEVDGKVIGISDEFDIALIKVDGFANEVALSLENNESPVGLEVIAFGSPHGFENSASIGYITGTGRNMEGDFVYNQLYQLDAQIDSGSSGGPLVDAKTGKVIGINSLVYTNNNNFAFAIPLYTMMPTINNWIAKPLTSDEVIKIGANKAYDEVFDGNEEDYFDTSIEESDIVQNYVTLFTEYKISSFNKGEFFWIADMIDDKTETYTNLEKQITNSFKAGTQYVEATSEIVDFQYDGTSYYVVMNEKYKQVEQDKTEKTVDIYRAYTVVVNDDDTIFITSMKDL